MLNKNYRRLVGGCIGSEGYIDLTTINNESKSADPRAWMSTDGSFYSRIIVGSGTTTPTEDDIKLENQINLTVSVNIQSNGNKNYLKTITTTYLNETDSDVVISEIGLVIYYSGNYFLLGRIVLDESVTIAVGDTYSFTYTIK